MVELQTIPKFTREHKQMRVCLWVDKLEWMVRKDMREQLPERR